MPLRLKVHGLGPKRGLPHINRHAAGGLNARPNDALHGFTGNFGFIRQTQMPDVHGKAARAVAAHLDFAAVTVKDPVLKVRLSCLGLFNHQHLVTADAEVAVTERAHECGRSVKGLIPGIDHDEIVARTLHFGKGKTHACVSKNI